MNECYQNSSFLLLNFNNNINNNPNKYSKKRNLLSGIRPIWRNINALIGKSFFLIGKSNCREDPSPGRAGRSNPRVTIPVSGQSSGSFREGRKGLFVQTAGIRAVNIVWGGVTRARTREKFDFASRNLRSAEVFRRNVTTTKRGNHACHLGNPAVLTRRPINGRLDDLIIYGRRRRWFN